MKILNGILDNQRSCVGLFKFVISKVEDEKDELDIYGDLIPGNYYEQHLRETMVSQEAKSLIYKMTAMGCFGLDRHSGNFDVNSFFDGSCTKKIMLGVLIYLSELAEMNILDK